MAIYTTGSKLSEIILNDPSLIPIINRFNIFLGVADKTVEDICNEKSLDANFFIAILNTFINDEYFPEKIIKSFNIKIIIDYLYKTNNYYKHFQLPNIERHFNSLISKSDSGNNNLYLMQKFFFEMKQELLAQIDYDQNEWFPKILKIGSSISDYNKEIILNHNDDEPNPIEDKLNDLKSFFIIHLRGEYDFNLCNAVIAAICTLEKDIKQNNRIRNRILKPMTNVLIK